MRVRGGWAAPAVQAAKPSRPHMPGGSTRQARGRFAPPFRCRIGPVALWTGRASQATTVARCGACPAAAAGRVMDEQTGLLHLSGIATILPRGKQLFKFTKYTDRIFIETVYGGAKIGDQIKRLERPTHIVVATPGRLFQHLPFH